MSRIGTCEQSQLSCLLLYNVVNKLHTSAAYKCIFLLKVQLRSTTKLAFTVDLLYASAKNHDALSASLQIILSNVNGK